MARNGIGAQDMSGKGIELGRVVAQEVCEGDGWKRMRIGVRGRVRKNHCHKGNENFAKGQKE